jgi:predicted ATPase
MIKEITIKNFKSIAELKLELGRFNVLIGENGSGKTNVLEAVAFGAAAAADKLDNEFLSSRGIRVTGPEFMRSAFDAGTKNDEITLSFISDDIPDINFHLTNDNKPYSKWVCEGEAAFSLKVMQSLEKKQNMFKKKIKKLEKLEKEHKETFEKEFQIFKDELKTFSHTVFGIFRKARMFQSDDSEGPFLVTKVLDLSHFIIYSPENTSLRTFEKEGQILPLGIKGEGLFKLVKNLSMDKDKKPIEEIKENLKLMDWFEDFQLPEAIAPNEFVLKIKDRFLNSQLNYFDQRSSNEGFLFLLFYLALFISKDTPTFFAVDNLEASFNPKLCVEVSKTLIRLCNKKKKQVIVTTQNPSILDGINLNNPDERLFVIKRNTQGHTIAKRITAKPESKTPVKLSDAWTRGYIGGLPKNF